MGGRGASSGLSDSGKPYGTEFKTLFQFGNIKFVSDNDGMNKTPLETMTKGRVYVTVNERENTLKSISFYDKENKRFKQIDMDHYHRINGKSEKPHIQMGYYHDGEAFVPTANDSKLIDKVVKMWYSKLHKL